MLGVTPYDIKTNFYKCEALKSILECNERFCRWWQYDGFGTAGIGVLQENHDNQIFFEFLWFLLNKQ